MSESVLYRCFQSVQVVPVYPISSHLYVSTDPCPLQWISSVPLLPICSSSSCSPISSHMYVSTGPCPLQWISSVPLLPICSSSSCLSPLVRACSSSSTSGVWLCVSAIVSCRPSSRTTPVRTAPTWSPACERLTPTATTRLASVSERPRPRSPPHTVYPVYSRYPPSLSSPPRVPHAVTTCDQCSKIQPTRTPETADV